MLRDKYGRAMVWYGALLGHISSELQTYLGFDMLFEREPFSV